MTRPATEYISAKDTAVLIRKALKENFTGVKFSVRTSTYAGGASVHVAYDNADVPTQSVQDVAYRFQGATFDGMTDTKSYHTSELDDGRRVRFGADFVFVRNAADWRR